LSKKPQVAAEISRLIALRFPESIDPSKVLRQALESMMTLSQTGNDRIRLRASIWLVEYALAHESLMTTGPGDRVVHP
jgi:hypothetical protein